MVVLVEINGVLTETKRVLLDLFVFGTGKPWESAAVFASCFITVSYRKLRRYKDGLVGKHQ